MKGKCGTTHTVPLGFLCLLICSIPVVVYASYDLCEFNAFLATCSVHIVDAYPAEMTIIFNQCHKPIDITFILEAVHRGIHWKYTYVTTNEVETRDIPEFLEGHTVSLRVHMERAYDAVDIVADFMLDGEQDVVVMNTTVSVPTFDVCVHLGNNLTGRILLGVLLSSVLLVLCSFVAVYACRHRTNNKADRFPLVDDAEALARASTSFTLLTDNCQSASTSPDEPTSGAIPTEQPLRPGCRMEYRPISDASPDVPPSLTTGT